MAKKLSDLPVRIGVNPIVWSNDDFHDLGGDIPLERCLSEIHAAGYAGTELGHKYPRDPRLLAPLLRAHELELVSGWHSLHLLERPFEEEAREYLRHLDLLALLRSRVVIVAECSRRLYDDPATSLQFDGWSDTLSPPEWTQLTTGLEKLAEMAAARGLRLVYHHHMGTVIQSEADIDELMQRTHDTGLLADTGHLAFAGIEPLSVLRRHAQRIAHVHLKSVRPEIVRRAEEGTWSFAYAVRQGVFTVPGDGGIDFEPIFAQLAEASYRGWLVVEAEQDPAVAPPLRCAEAARAYIRRTTGL